VAAIVRREKRQFGIKAVFLDHIQLLRYKGESRTEGLTEASITLKNSAHDSGVCHVVLFQLNRQGAKKHTDGTSVRPSAADVKDFDQLLSDVDGMAMLWSEQDKTSLGKGERLEVNFYSAKNRSGGETEEPVYFDGPYISFVNSPQDHVPTFKQPAPSIPYPYDK
jgi:replicative DNA helicase